MRTMLLAATLIAVASIAQAQAPSPKLPNQAALPSPSDSPAATPNPGNDEISARRKLEEQGYRDLRNVTPNGDGTFSAQGARQPRGSLHPQPETRLDIDSSGNVRER